MKRLLLTTWIVSLFLLGGCDEFLNEEPDNRAKVETASDIQELLVNAYPQATYHLICEMMSDNVSDRGFSQSCVTAVTDDEMYFWKDGTSSDYDAPFAVWTGFYEGIAAANYAIRVIESKPDRENYLPMLGEALLCRALGHFLLVNLWAEHYDPATAETALGIPYVLEPETVAVKEYTRNTMAEVYTLIEADIRRGIQMIDDNVYDVPVYHFTKRAAHAFAARFYTYKGDEWDKVLYHSLQAAPDDFRTEMRDIISKRSMTALEYALDYTDPGQSTILLSVCVPTYYNDIWATCPIVNSRYVLTPTMQFNLYGVSRLTPAKGTLAYRIEGMSGTSASHMMKNYGYFKSESATSNRGMSYLNIPMFTVEDVALNRIEAYIMLEEYDLAIRDLSRFYSTRVLNFGDTQITLEEFIDFYKYEYDSRSNPIEPHYKDILQADEKKFYLTTAVEHLRKLEFMQEGLRWFDIKRFHLPVTHSVHSESEKMTLGRYDLRRALQIPQEAQKAGVTPNER